MTHAALVNGVVFWLVVAMAVLLVMFIYAVITTPPQDAAPAEPAAPEPSALEWTTPTARPAQRPPAPASPAGVTGQPRGTGYPARHGPAAAPVISPPKASSRPQWGPAGATILAIAGLATAVTGGRMFLITGQTPKACLHQAVAICLDGFVLLDATQLAGGVIALAGIGLIVTAIVLALR